MRQPWGNTAESAARWAFGMLGRSPSAPISLESLHRSSAGPRYDLSRLEQAAQAAVIRMEVDRMENPQAKSLLWALYIPRPQLERQAGGGPRQMVDRFPDIRQFHIYNVAWWLMGTEGTGLHRIRGYRELVAQFTTSEESIDRLRALLQTSPARATDTRKRCYEKLDGLHKLALLLLEDRLVTAGLVEQAAADA